jgi:hypothetical protein
MNTKRVKSFIGRYWQFAVALVLIMGVVNSVITFLWYLPVYPTLTQVLLLTNWLLWTICGFIGGGGLIVNGIETLERKKKEKQVKPLCVWEMEEPNSYDVTTGCERILVDAHLYLELSQLLYCPFCGKDIKWKKKR